MLVGLLDLNKMRQIYMARHCTGIIQQTNLSKTDFASRLLMLDGDLGTCVNVKCLQNQQFPSLHIEDSLENACPLLGASHTLWNISHAVYTKHYGRPSNSRDSGAWRYLESLGIPLRKTLDQKDFTLMISNMVKIQEVTLVHCILSVGTLPHSSNIQYKLTFSVCPGKLWKKETNHWILNFLLSH
jgi:hypothetical protein